MKITQFALLISFMTLAVPYAKGLIISNGGFESGLNGWNATPTGGTIAINSSAQSPFSSGTQGVDINDTTATGPSKLSQNFSSAIDSTLTISADFKVLSSTYTGADGLFTLRVFDSAGTSVNLAFLGNGTVRLGNTTIAGLTFNIGTWYQVSLAVPSLASGLNTASLTLTPYGGSATTVVTAGWSGFTGTQYKSIMIQPGISTHLTEDYVDNISVLAVPEPSGKALISIGLSMLVVFGGWRKLNRPASVRI